MKRLLLAVFYYVLQHDDGIGRRGSFTRGCTECHTPKNPNDLVLPYLNWCHFSSSIFWREDVVCLFFMGPCVTQ